MMKNMRYIFIGALILAGTASAQPLPDALLVAGTVTRDGSNRDLPLVHTGPASLSSTCLWCR